MKLSLKNCSLKRVDRLIHAFGCIATIAIAAVAYILLILPYQNIAAESRDKIAELRSLQYQTEDLERETILLQSELDRTEAQFEALANRIPEQPAEDQFLRLLSRAARQHSFRIQDYRPGASEFAEEFASLKISLSGEGSFVSICQFLQELRQLDRLNRIDSMQLTPLAGQSDYFSMFATIRIFFRHQKVATIERATK